MKGISGNPALDAYQRMAVNPVSGAKHAARPEADSSGPQEAAKVSISATARELAVGAAPGGVDVNKVEALRSSIADGTFQVDARQIAGRMIDELG